MFTKSCGGTRNLHHTLYYCANPVVYVVYLWFVIHTNRICHAERAQGICTITHSVHRAGSFMYSVHSVVYVVQYHRSQASPAPDFDHKLVSDIKLGADQ